MANGPWFRPGVGPHLDRKGSGPKNQYDCAKAIAFFDQHGNHNALRRGIGGVREYVAELLPLI